MFSDLVTLYIKFSGSKQTAIFTRFGVLGSKMSTLRMNNYAKEGTKLWPIVKEPLLSRVLFCLKRGPKICTCCLSSESSPSCRLTILKRSHAVLLPHARWKMECSLRVSFQAKMSWGLLCFLGGIICTV